MFEMLEDNALIGELPGDKGFEVLDEAQGLGVAAVDGQLTPVDAGCIVELFCIVCVMGCRGCENWVVCGLRVPKAARSGVTVRNDGCALGALNGLLLVGVVDQEN